MARLNLRNTNRSLAFDGSTSSVTVPVTPSTTAFGVAFWFYSRSLTLNNRVVDWQAAGPADGFTIVQGVSGEATLAFRLSNGGGSIADMNTSKLAVGQWYHVAFNYAVNAMEVFVNGVSVNTDTSGTMTTAATTLTLGKRATSAANFFNGFIDDFVFKNGSILTQNEITALASGTIPSGLTVYYSCDGNVIDSSGNGNDGTASGAGLTYGVGVNPFPRRPLGIRSAKALNFAGPTTSVVAVTDTAILRPETTNKFSWCCWIYWFQINNNPLPFIISKAPHYISCMGDQTNSRANQLAMEIVNSVGGTATEFWGSTRMQPGQWYRLCSTFNDATCQHYINGMAETMTTLVGPYVSPLADSSGSPLRFGNSNGLDRNVNGLISNVLMYNRALTAAEALADFQGTIATSGLVGKWNFDEGSGNPADSSGNGHNGTVSNATWESVSSTRSSV